MKNMLKLIVGGLLVILMIRDSGSCVEFPEKELPIIDMDLSDTYTKYSYFIDGVFYPPDELDTLPQRFPAIEFLLSGDELDYSDIVKAYPPPYHEDYKKMEDFDVSTSIFFWVDREGNICQSWIERSTGSLEWDSLILSSFLKWKFSSLDSLRDGRVYFNFYLK
jgi:hypothetical protein